MTPENSVEMDKEPKLKVAINGFGRIGRNAFKVWFDKHMESMDVVAINDITPVHVNASLLKSDTVYGVWPHEVSFEESVDDIKNAKEGESVGKIKVDGHEIQIYATKDPSKLPWGELGVDVVIESTGRFTNAKDAGAHLASGAKKVVISAPAKDAPTYVLGVNEDKYDSEEIINNASCTTNCIAPVTEVIMESFDVELSDMITIHAMTAGQNLVDSPPPGGKTNDMRRARSAPYNMIPTTTGAAIAATEAIPALKDKFDGVAVRVPVISGSLAILVYVMNKDVTIEEVNDSLIAASDTERYKGILATSSEDLVSSDIIGRPESSIVDLQMTKVIGKRLVHIFAWYDNEFGYSNRLIEQVIQVGNHS